jgi:hypothetical protein
MGYVTLPFSCFMIEYPHACHNQQHNYVGQVLFNVDGRMIRSVVYVDHNIPRNLKKTIYGYSMRL